MSPQTYTSSPASAFYRDDNFKILQNMQEAHFWYRGRHQLLLDRVKFFVNKHFGNSTPVRAIDLGGGCGGWVSYLNRHRDFPVAELALGERAPEALERSGEFLGKELQCHQVDLTQKHFSSRWEVVFSLDVIEHLPDDSTALDHIRESLVHGGLLFITVPALKFFWTWNDEVVGHQRRYSKTDLLKLAEKTGFEVLEVRYFLFLLSPLLLLSRVFTKPTEGMTEQEKLALVAKTHKVPSALPNTFLTAVFLFENFLAKFFPFPWGTSAMAVLRKK